MDHNPFAPEVLAEPSVSYEALLERTPVHRCEQFDPPFYTLSRYDDVAEALRDIDTYSSEWGQGPRVTPPAGMLSNPPQHTFFRGLVQQAFTPRAIEALRARVEALAEELLDGCSGNWDLHDDYGFPLPVIVIAEQLGVPSDDLHRFKRWSDASVEAMGAEDPTAWASELGEMAAYLLQRVAEEREAAGGDTIIARLLAARRDGRGLADDEILSVLTQLLVGGNETTTSCITNMVWRLLEHRELWEQVCANESLVPVAVEESLRFDPPVLGLYRTTTRDVTLHGVTIPADSKVMLHYAAANRDPRAWEDGHRFTLASRGRKHMAFGLGVHFCLGAQLARLEAEIALRTLVRRVPDLQLVDAGERIAPFFLWGRKHLPVRS